MKVFRELMELRKDNVETQPVEQETTKVEFVIECSLFAKAFI
jgi:hypothetical protein